jgi:NAD-dependent DNA ligase
MVSKKTIREIEEKPRKWSKKVKTEELENLLYQFNYAYFNETEPLITDKAFDILRGELEKRNPESKILTKIGETPDSGKVEKLPYFLGSLNKYYPEDEIEKKWIKEYPGPYTISDKLDGISALIYVDNKKEVKLYTRGDGTNGTNITHLLNIIKINKKAIEKLEEGYGVRGELVISWKEFEEIKDKRSHPRSAVAGIAGATKKPEINIAKRIEFVAYELMYPNYKHSEQLKKLEEWGFKVVYYEKREKVYEEILANLTVERKNKSKYPIDGIVCYDDSKKYKHQKANPSYAIAFKIDGEIVRTEVTGVRWSVSRHGQIKPVVLLKPIKIDGFDIKNVTAHHAKYIVDKGIGKGAEVDMIKAGEITPYIARVYKTAKKVSLPNIDYHWDETKTNIIAENIDTPEVKALKMNHFFNTLNIKNISDKTLIKLAEKEYDTIIKFAKATAEELSEIDEISLKVIKKVKEDFKEKIKNTTLAKLMSASGCFGKGLGERKLAELIREIPEIMKEENKDDLYEKVKNIEGFAEKTANQFVQNFEKFKKFFKELNKYYPIEYLAKKIKNKKTKERFKSQKIVFTGFRGYDFDYLKEKIEEEGGKVTSTVSKNTNMVVYKEGSAGSKYKKAKELGIETVKLEDFKKKYDF